MDKKVSLKDVANHVGVSIALVSYVINNKVKKAGVTPEVAEKIRTAAAKLNYQPNLIAKSLKMGRTNTIGLIVADISNTFFSNIARIIEDEARKRDYVVIFGSSDESADMSQRLINVFLTRQVDGFIIAPTEHTEYQVRDLQKRNIPVVLIDRYFPVVDADSVHINNFQAAFDAVDYLAKKGRKKIAMMAYDTTLPHMRERMNGYKEALKSNGIRFNQTWLRKASHQHIARDVAKEMKELLLPKLKVDAFFFATNTLAVECLKIINKSGVRVPEELAIISFDESDAFDFFYSPVTYVSQSIEEIGKGAVKLMMERIASPAKEYASIEVEAKLVLRKSSGKTVT